MLRYQAYGMPRSREELFALMERAPCPFEIVSGGTDLFAEEWDQHTPPACAIDISGVDEFCLVQWKPGQIELGANTTIQRFLDDAELIEHVPMLRHAAIYFADQQIRESATLGGNLANASPSGDMIPPLLAMDATIHTLRKSEGAICERDIAMADFVEGVGKTLLRKGEVIRAVSCPTLPGYGCAFKKVGLRRSLCISAVNAAFLVKADEGNQRFEDVRIAFGGVGPTPVRLRETENRLKGKEITKEILHEMVGQIPDDMVRSRSRRAYRETVIGNFLLAGLYESLAELGIVLT